MRQAQDCAQAWAWQVDLDCFRSARPALEHKRAVGHQHRLGDSAYGSLDRLRLRGPNGARDEFILAATAQNLRKMAKLIPMPIPTPA